MVQENVITVQENNDGVGDHDDGVGARGVAGENGVGTLRVMNVNLQSFNISESFTNPLREITRNAVTGCGFLSMNLSRRWKRHLIDPTAWEGSLLGGCRFISFILLTRGCKRLSASGLLAGWLCSWRLELGSILRDRSWTRQLEAGVGGRNLSPTCQHPVKPLTHSLTSKRWSQELEAGGGSRSWRLELEGEACHWIRT